MSEKSPIGSYVIAITHQELFGSVTKLVGALQPDQFSRLKVSSGEHLAAILITAFLGTPPKSIDSTGETDLLFKIPQSLPGHPLGRRLGLGNKRFADFEVKSLPGEFRKYDALIDQALKTGMSADQTPFKATVTSINAVLREARPTVLRAKRQLDMKKRPEHSRNIFLIVHFFDYPTVECYKSQLIAHLLDPIDDLGGIDSMWVLWAPTHLVVWSSEHRQWTNLIFSAIDPSSTIPDRDESIELLQQVELEFLKKTNYSGQSPYVFSLTAAGDEASDPRSDTNRPAST